MEFDQLVVIYLNIAQSTYELQLIPSNNRHLIMSSQLYKFSTWAENFRMVDIRIKA